MKIEPFNKTLSEAQDWVGKNGIYAVGESTSKRGEKIILIFAVDSMKLKNVIPATFNGYKVQFYETGEIFPQEGDQEE